ncbi:MAG: WD40 repeat domain-containing protein [Cyanobacteria bacterium J06598_4]
MALYALSTYHKYIRMSYTSYLFRRTVFVPVITLTTALVAGSCTQPKIPTFSKVASYAQSRNINDEDRDEYSTGSLIFSPDGQYLVSENHAQKYQIVVWDIQEDTEVMRLREPRISGGISFDPYGGQFALPNLDAVAVFLTQPIMGSAQLTLEEGNGFIETAFNPHRPMLLSTYFDHSELETDESEKFVAVWDFKNKEEILKLPYGLVEAASFGADGDSLITGGVDGTLRVWDIESGNEVSRIDLGDTIALDEVDSEGAGIIPSRVGAVPGSQYIWATSYSSSPNSFFGVWDSESGEAIWIEYDLYWGIPAAVSADGQTAAAIQNVAEAPRVDPTLSVWDMQSGKEIVQVESTEECTFTWGNNRSLSLSADGSYLATRCFYQPGGGSSTSSDDISRTEHYIAIFDLENGVKTLFPLDDWRRDYRRTFSFSQDGQRLAVKYISEDRVGVDVWDIQWGN